MSSFRDMPWQLGRGEVRQTTAPNLSEPYGDRRAHTIDGGLVHAAEYASAFEPSEVTVAAPCCGRPAGGGMAAGAGERYGGQHEAGWALPWLNLRTAGVQSVGHKSSAWLILYFLQPGAVAMSAEYHKRGEVLRSHPNSFLVAG